MWILWLLWLALAGPLELQTVLDGVDARLPEVAAAEAKQDMAEAKAMSTRGAFDPTLSAKGRQYAGKDPRSVAQTTLAGDTSVGPRWAVGYQAGLGDFPAYARDDATGDAGEWIGRIEVPLLDGLGMGSARADRIAADYRVDAAEQRRDAVRIALQAKASAAYWKWVAAGEKRAIYTRLLEMAERRQVGLDREVELGQRARIDQLDNERVVFERRDAARAADAALASAAADLSLYYRDAEGQPMAPSPDQLPAIAGESAPLAPEADDVARALAHPALAALDADLDAQRAQVRGARNGVLPDLDLSLTQTAPVGSGSAETIAGVDLKVPLGLRKDRGALGIETAQSELQDQALRLERDARLADLQALRAAADAARERLTATREGVERAREVARLEGRRFELGGSEIFALLLREERVAKAELAAVEAALTDRMVAAALGAIAPGAPIP